MAAIAGWIVNKNWGFDAFCVPSLSPVQYIPAMLETLKSLPDDDPEDLKGLVALMGEEIKSLTLKVEDLQGQLAAHRKARFGSKSEKPRSAGLRLAGRHRDRAGRSGAA